MRNFVTFTLLGVILVAVASSLIGSTLGVFDIWKLEGALVETHAVERTALVLGLISIASIGFIWHKGKEGGALSLGRACLLAGAMAMGGGLAFAGPWLNHFVIERSTGLYGETWQHCMTYALRQGRNTTHFHVYSSQSDACLDLQSALPYRAYSSDLPEVMAHINAVYD